MKKNIKGCRLLCGRSWLLVIVMVMVMGLVTFVIMQQIDSGKKSVLPTFEQLQDGLMRQDFYSIDPRVTVKPTNDDFVIVASSVSGDGTKVVFAEQHKCLLLDYAESLDLSAAVAFCGGKYDTGDSGYHIYLKDLSTNVLEKLPVSAPVQHRVFFPFGWAVNDSKIIFRLSVSLFQGGESGGADVEYQYVAYNLVSRSIEPVAKQLAVFTKDRSAVVYTESIYAGVEPLWGAPEDFVGQILWYRDVATGIETKVFEKKSAGFGGVSFSPDEREVTFMVWNYQVNADGFIDQEKEPISKVSKTIVLPE